MKEKKVSSFRVWLAMKGKYGPFVRVEDFDVDAIVSLCGFKNSSTVYYHLKKLLKWNWVGKGNGKYFLRPMSFLCDKYNIRSGKVHKVDLLKQLSDIKELLFAMSVKGLIIYRKFVGRKIRRYEQADETVYKLQDYKPSTLSVRLLAQLLGLSVNMVHRLKHRCMDLGYMTREKNSRLVQEFERALLHELHFEKLFTELGDLKIRLADDLFPNINTRVSKAYSV